MELSGDSSCSNKGECYLTTIPYRPHKRKRYVSQALQAYAALITSAAQGAVRDVGQLRRGS